MDEDELAKRRAARREHPSSLPAPLSAHPWHDESPTELRARLEAMQNLVIDVAHTHDDLKMHDLAEVLRRAPSERSRATWIRSSDARLIPWSLYQAHAATAEHTGREDLLSTATLQRSLASVVGLARTRQPHTRK